MTRSENMKRIKSKDTAIEIILREALWRKGYRYKKNCKDVIGKPDLCFKSKKIAIFCDSEFWHGKYLQEGKYIPKTNREFWIKKLQRNLERDKTVNEKLKEQGWTVLRFWEKDIRAKLEECVEKFESVYNRL